nr:hypothetical protein CFP56_48837 [Quercus suber]
MTDPPPQRPPMQTRDTLSASRLNGTLQKDDVVAVEVVQEENGVAQGVKSESQDPDVDSDGSLEDYDTLEVDPDTLVANSRRGMSSSYRPSGSVMSTELNDEARTQAGSDVAGTAQSKRSSLHVRLAKTDTRGRYVLTADDPELQEILRKGLERENRDDSKKPRVRFRDLPEELAGLWQHSGQQRDDEDYVQPGRAGTGHHRWGHVRVVSRGLLLPEARAKGIHQLEQRRLGHSEHLAECLPCGRHRMGVLS